MRTSIFIVALAAAALAATTAAAAPKWQQPKTQSLAQQLAVTRDATAKYVDGLARAKADGYQILTKMIPNMGYHFINPSVKTFDLRKPPILVYEHQGKAWRLGAVEWVFPAKPATPPVPGAKYGTFGAACHYKDGTFVFADAAEQCASTAPGTGAKFNFWHGPLVTMHIWLWYPNPLGLFSGMNSLASVFNGG